MICFAFFISVRQECSKGQPSRSKHCRQFSLNSRTIRCKNLSFYTHVFHNSAAQFRRLCNDKFRTHRTSRSKKSKVWGVISGHAMSPNIKIKLSEFVHLKICSFPLAVYEVAWSWLNKLQANSGPTDTLYDFILWSFKNLIKFGFLHGFTASF